MKDYGIKHLVNLEEREIIFLIEILTEKIEDPNTAINGLGKLIQTLEDSIKEAQQ